MKKRPAIGVSIAVLVLSVIIGIASLPDEVLSNPSSVENPQTIPEDIPIVPTLEETQDFISSSDAQKKIDDANAELNSLKKEIRELKNELVDLKINPQVPEETLTITEVEAVTPKVNSEESQGKVIKINIKDGVGAKQK